MPIDVGSIDSSELKEQITNEIMDSLEGLSKEEKEELLTRREKRIKECEDDDLWCTHFDSAKKCYLIGIEVMKKLLFCQIQSMVQHTRLLVTHFKVAI